MDNEREDIDFERDDRSLEMWGDGEMLTVLASKKGDDATNNISYGINPNEQKALFRYLAGRLLPKVERKEQGTRSRGIDPVWRYEGITYLIQDGRKSLWSPVDCCSAQELRALAACLLMAADEAEGGREDE